jgi:hypothetical protein
MYLENDKNFVNQNALLISTVRVVSVEFISLLFIVGPTVHTLLQTKVSINIQFK